MSYIIMVALHILNTILVFQYLIGTNLKELNREQKINDIPRVRLFASLFIITLTPAIAMLVNRVQDH